MNTIIIYRMGGNLDITEHLDINLYNRSYIGRITYYIVYLEIHYIF